MIVFLAVAVAVLAASGVAGVLVLGTEAGERPPALRSADLQPCRGLDEDATRTCIIREFQSTVRGQDDPRPAVEAIADMVRSEGGALLSDCHGLMHTVGRTYARDEGVTLGSLMDYLPQTNDPGCSAGFAHGMVTAVAPEIDVSNPRESATVCADAGTRFQRYSCIHGFGHAFMRLYEDQLEPARERCAALGAVAAPACAPGAAPYPWLAVVGADAATLSGEAITDPRRLCGAQPEQYVRACWYRAFIDNRPQGFQLTLPEDLDGLCGGLEGLQRGACMTAASVIGPPDPAEQLALCARLADASDAANCVRGTKVQNLLDAPIEDFVRLIRRCGRFDGSARAECYRWLGKTLSVLTDGEFGRSGCPQLGAAARRECEAGAATIDEALVTFS